MGGCCPLGVWQQLAFFLLELPCHPTEPSVQVVTLLGSVTPGTFLALLFSSWLVLDLWPHANDLHLSIAECSSKGGGQCTLGVCSRFGLMLWMVVIF